MRTRLRQQQGSMRCPALVAICVAGAVFALLQVFDPAASRDLVLAHEARNELIMRQKVFHVHDDMHEDVHDTEMEDAQRAEGDYGPGEDDSRAQVEQVDDKEIIDAPDMSFIPVSSKMMSFGVRHGHRLAHVAARAKRSKIHTTRTKYNNPVIEDAEQELLPFHEKFVREKFRNTPRIEMEAEYFRFEDDFGLIDTGWSDEEILHALQRLIDIYAQANIRIRIRRNEAIARVKLSRERSLAYWFYVDYPKEYRRGEMSAERRARKDLMTSIIGPDLVHLLEKIDGERQGLFDWIMGWPEERTPWENENVVGMYPSFYYFFMNGGGEGGCMRFRTGDCNTPKKIKGVPGDLNVYCYRLDVSRREKQVEVPIVRSWERYNFTSDMAIRLVAHEMGHAMKLRHPNSGCVQVTNWEMGNLMSQVMSMAGPGKTCRVTGWPELAAKATYLTDDQIMSAREAVKKDLRETNTVQGSRHIGKSVEVLATPCRIAKSIAGFMLASFPLPKDGMVTRVRWKSGTTFTASDRLQISVGRFMSKSWKATSSEIVRPHTIGSFVHQEHDVSLQGRQGDMVAIFLNTPGHSEGLNPESHTYEDPDVLHVDIVGATPMSKRNHPTVNQVMSILDKNTIYPKIAPRATPLSGIHILTIDAGWIDTDRCPDWIFNYDLDDSASDV